MKTIGKCVAIAVIFLVATVSLLRVDRQCQLMYGTDNSISASLQLFIENKLNLH